MSMKTRVKSKHPQFKTSHENLLRLAFIVLPPSDRLSAAQRKRWARVLAYRRKVGSPNHERQQS